MDRQHILNEIRRTAVDGKPLGRSQFLAQTGIKESDWLGKYWVRWSEVQAEAGFEPLNFNSSFEEGHILTSVLALIRKLGKFPTTAEMRLERRTNSLFPNDKTISSRGGRSALVQKLLEFCRDQPEYQDVQQILISIPVSKNSVETPEEAMFVRQDGYVYLIRAQGAYKIGCTRALYRRAAEITNQSASGAELLHHITTDDPEGIERYWHERFSSRRILAMNKQSGEWFDLKTEDIKAFKKRKFM